MKKILLIENRTSRQIQYLPNGEQDVHALNELSFLRNSIEEKCKEDLHKIEINDLSFFKHYDLIAIHRSALSNLLLGGSAISGVIDFCSKNNIDLILFSGGISNSFYSEDGGKYLLINSKDFYSANLIHFLNDYSKGVEEQLIALKYGKAWRLTYLLKLRELVLLGNTMDSGDFRKENISELLFKGKQFTLNLLNKEINQIQCSI